MDYGFAANGLADDVDRERVGGLKGTKYYKEGVSKTYPVGATILDRMDGRVAKYGSAYRKKISGGTVTSVIMYGLLPDGTRSAALATILDDAVFTMNFEGFVATTVVVNSIPPYEQYIFELIVAGTPVVLDWFILLES